MAENSAEKAVKSAKSENFLRQFRDKKTREFKKITAGQFMDVWNHYDEDGKIHGSMYLYFHLKFSFH